MPRLSYSDPCESMTNVGPSRGDDDRVGRFARVSCASCTPRETAWAVLGPRRTLANRPCERPCESSPNSGVKRREVERKTGTNAREVQRVGLKVTARGVTPNRTGSRSI